MSSNSFTESEILGVFKNATLHMHTFIAQIHIRRDDCSMQVWIGVQRANAADTLPPMTCLAYSTPTGLCKEIISHPSAVVAASWFAKRLARKYNTHVLVSTPVEASPLDDFSNLKELEVALCTSIDKHRIKHT